MSASGVLVDIRPLRESRDFRLLYSGQTISSLGRQLTVVAAPVQVYAITDSSLAVGGLGLVQLPVVLLGSLLGGALADAYDRRRLLVITQMVLFVTSVGLALNAAGAERLWLIYALTALQGGIFSIDQPTRNAATPMLVHKTLMPAAAALNQVLFHVGGLFGPAVAGFLIEYVNLASAYWIDAVTFLVSLVAILAVRPLPPAGGGTKAGSKSVLEGLNYLRGRQALQGTFVVDINAMVFGMPRALFPELAATTFAGQAGAAGLLYAAPGAGGLVAAMTSGWVTRVRHQGRAVLWAVAAWGAAIAVFGMTSWFWLAFFCLAVAGAADVVSAVFRNTILQLSVPDRLRGRLSAVHIAVVTGGPRLGDAEAGAVAAVTSVRFSAISGGLACMAGVAVIGRLMPGLGRWTLDDAVDDDEPTSGS
ncbi:MAG: MFS transporter [Actinomycetia bacterium]|nr:MFS transporter [Actinomycetes bacterium]